MALFYRISFQDKKRVKNQVTSEEIYNKFVKPQVMGNLSTKDSYRSYIISNCSSISAVNYKLDIMEKMIREEMTSYLQSHIELMRKKLNSKNKL